MTNQYSEEITEIITTEQSTDDIEKSADRKAGPRQLAKRDILNSKHVKENNLITKFATFSNINTVTNKCLTLLDHLKIKQVVRKIKYNFVAQLQRKQV